MYPTAIFALPLLNARKTLMPAEPYVTVTLRKDIVKKLIELNPKKPTSALITEAILEYISTKTYKLENKTPYFDLFKIDGISTIDLACKCLLLHSTQDDI